MGSAQRINRRDLRRDTRFATAFEAHLICGENRFSVTVGDISANGALIKGDQFFGVARKVRLRAAGLDISARVMWVDHGLCGVSFERPVNPLAVVRDNIPSFRDMRARLGDVTLPSQAWESCPIAP